MPRQSPRRLPSLEAIASVVAKNPPRNRYKEDPLFRITTATRSSVYGALKKKRFTKRSSTLKMIGCTFDELKRHLEKQFQKGMTWDNYGEWHVDHRMPISSAKSLEQLEYLLHYMNLQPMWASENILKNDNMPKKVQLHLYLK